MKVNIIKSNRKTIAIQINPDLSVTVRAPRRVAQRDIEKILSDKEAWILKHIESMRQKNAALENSAQQRLTNDEIRELAEKALKYIPERVAYFAEQVGVSYGRITIRSQKTRWGSCSNKGNLNFNCLLMLTPPEVIDYVMVHELCHRKEMNHSKAFWNEVGKVLPDYKIWEKWLKNEGGNIMARIR